MYYLTKETYDLYLKAKEEGKDKIVLSLDLGRNKTLTTVEILDKIFSKIKKIKPKEIYIYDGQKVFKPQIMNNGLYSLGLEEHNYPCLYINGVKMNTGKDLGINKYNQSVIKNLKLEEHDIVLEVCTGLGYKAIALSEVARKVYTIEKSKEVLELAKLNPYSNELFKRKNIKIFNDDAFEKISDFENNTFTRIVHDPPTFKFAPELYSEEFYLELYRVAKEKALLFHYTGNPGIKYRNKNIVKATQERLRACNWKIIKTADLGVYAVRD